MRLSKYKYTEKEKLSEFDRWITPSLGDIKDRIEFKNVLAELEDGFNSLSNYTNGFSALETCSSHHIAENITFHVGQINDIQNHLANVFNAILLSTGKTDNNLKCQYPLVLNKLYEIVKKEDIENIDIVGVETDASVLATLFSLWDAKLPFTLLKSRTMGKYGIHEAAKLIPLFSYISK